MDCLGIAINLANLAPTQYRGYDFQAMAHMGGVPAGAGEAGLFQLNTGSADIIDPGAPGSGTRLIDAAFELVTSDFGEPRQKRLRHLLVSGETDGQLRVTATYDQQQTVAYDLKPPSTGQHQEGLWAPGSRRLKGRHIALGVANVDGCDFSVDAISIYVDPVGHRRGR
jgi:hypothetical protein